MLFFRRPSHGVVGYRASTHSNHSVHTRFSHAQIGEERNHIQTHLEETILVSKPMSHLLTRIPRNLWICTVLLIGKVIYAIIILLIQDIIDHSRQSEHSLSTCVAQTLCRKGMKFNALFGRRAFLLLKSEISIVSRMELKWKQLRRKINTFTWCFLTN